MKIVLDFNVSADSAENATTVKVITALAGIMAGGETSVLAPSKKTAPELVKETVTAKAEATAKTVETKVPVKEAVAPAKEAVAVAHAKGEKAEDVIARIMVIATRHNKKGKSADIKAIKTKYIDASEKVGEVKDIKILRAMLLDYEAYDKGTAIEEIVKADAEQEEEF